MSSEHRDNAVEAALDSLMDKRADPPEGEELAVVRNWLRGSGKYHLPADEAKTVALCGYESWGRPSGGSFQLVGDRADFERLCPGRICERCRAIERGQHPSSIAGRTTNE